MWNYNEDYEKWILTEDTLLKSDFDYLKQELYTTRFYSKALSGSTYVDVDDVNNLFDTITNWRPRNWYISTSGSKYAVTNKPSDSAESIDLNSQYDFYTRNIKEYGLTLKNLFTPNRLIKDKLKSFINVDIATTTSINLNNISNNYYIDGVRLINEHVVLVKDQITNITLSSTIDPDTYFKGPYRVIENKSTEIIYFYNNNQNGLYKYIDGELIKMNDLDNYDMCSNLSVFVKSGVSNSNKQFHLKRLLNGYYPTSFLSDPMEFEEKHNWILRNRVDYNNLFETNYYDMIKHGTQSLFSNGITYSIPERLLTVGEFGIIVNNQYGLSTIIPNKWKSNLRSITHTKLYYWICGDDNTFLKINKTDFSISNIKLEGYNSYKCVSFNESFGVIVGDYNVLFYTDNGGSTWDRLKFEYFNSYSFNKVLIKNSNKFYVTGRGGVFLEFSKDINGWNSYKREISKKVDGDDENVLVDHINDIIFCNVSNWGLSYSYSTQSISSNKDILLMVADDNKFIIYDENNFATPDFLYLDFNYNYGNIKNISQQTGTSSFFFSNDNGVYKFDLNDFKYLGIGNTYSNVSKISTEIIKPKAVDNGLIFNLDVSNSTSYPGSDTNWNDLSISAISGTLSGDFSYSGLNGGYLSFNNNNTISYYQTNNNFNRVETMSWNVWFNRNASKNDFNVIFSHYLPYLSFKSTNQFLFSFYTMNNGSLNQRNLFSNNTYLNNVWYNVCCTLHINTSTGDVAAKMYVNGLLENEVYYPLSSNQLYNNSYKLLLASWRVNEFPFNGSISSFRIYNKILSADEVSQNYNSDKLKYYPNDDSVITNGPKLVFDKYVNKVYNNGNYLYLSGNYSLIKSSTHSQAYLFSDIDNSFSSKLHSKLLFMDYDMGSKLNFFTDEGEYRLPNSITIPDSYFLNIGSVLSFDAIKYIGLDNKEIIEKSWIDYWVDRQKTFEYYSENPDMILMNRKFSFNAKISATVSSVSNKEINLMPLINSKGVTSTRYYRNVGDPVIKDPSKMDTQNQLYLSGYLMVLVLGDPNSMNVKIGDVIRMESNVIDGNFIVNKILITDKNSKCVYMYSEFNNNIITNLTKIPNNIKFTNLNIFKDRDSFISNFNSHPFGIAYKATYSSGVKITPQFNNLTSYYNLGIYVNGISSGLNQFKQDNINYKILLNSGIPKTIYCPSNIEKITEVQVSIKILDSGRTSNNFIINLIGPNGKIINLHNGIIKNTNDSQIFKFSSISTIEFPVSGVGLAGGLYKMKYSLNVGVVYKSNETNISNLLFNNSSKGEWKLVVINVTTNLKNYLVDWDINFKGIIKEEMKYPDTFMKFGYTPMYNLLDYLSGINPINSKPIFHPEKEYLSLPVYNDIILYSLDSILNINDSDNYIYIKGSIKTNKLYFGFNLKFEWESIFLNTFVDINIYQPDGDINSLSRKLLVLKKYYDTEKRLYVIEFHNHIKFDSTKAFGGTTVIDITSRRKLSQISEDLQELNNIQRPMSKVSSTSNLSFTSYDSFLNFKIPTDSYTKVLLSDVETVKNLTGIIYTDYKNEIAFNITKLDKNYKVPIQNTIDQNGSLYIQCFEKHELSDGDGVMLEFNGGEFSSEYLNQQYFGYQVVDKVFNDYGFTVKLNYGNNVYVGNDTGYVKYIKKDPFFNYQPVDLIDLTDDKKIKQSIQIDPSNIQITGSTWSLVNLDYTKLRFRLVDGLSFEDLTSSYSWLLEAEISDAVIGLDSGGVVWYKGIWEFGRWFGGTWYSGTWNYGDWYGGKWNSSRIIDNNMSISIDKKAVSPEYSIWKTGRWYDGTWNNGTWQNGRWYAGSWNNGLWNNGIWNNGTWNNGYFRGGIWVDGIWNNGYFNTDNEPAYWLDGEWNSGDFENGMWYDGSFNQAFDGVSRFGTKSSNSRTSVWHSGNFKGGSFYSRIGTSLVSDVHKYSIWRTGNWLSGSWYGGIAYNIKFSSGSWYGGILEDIQIIGINSDNSFILNGVFRFNIGNVISITGDVNGKFAEFGNNDNPKKYKITDCEIDELNKITKIYVDYNIDLTNYNGFKSEIYDFNLISSGDYKLGTVKLNDYGVKISDLNIKIDLEITNNISNNSFYGVLGVTLPGSTFTDITFDGNVSNVYIVGTILYFSTETPSGSKITLSGPVTSSLYSGGKTVVKISSLQTTKIIQTTSKIFVTTGKFLNNILINLQSSNGNIINIKDVNSGLNSIYLRNSKFSTSSTNDIVSALNPVYEDVYKFQSSSNVGTNGYVSNITTKSDLFKDLKDDFWTIYIKSYNSTSFKINSLKMEISISDEIGAQLNKPISNGFDTGLRIVSEFNNSNWKSGIWSNGIFNGGLYEGGVWYDGIFNGKWI